MSDRRNCAGIFDRSVTGFRTAPAAVQIERGRIAFFCKAIGETNPIHFDVDAARAAGFPDVVAPATFAAAISIEANEQRIRRKEKSLLEIINCDYRRLLHGEERYEFHGLIFAGDTVMVEHEVGEFEDKKGGALELAHLTASIKHDERGLLVSITRTAIHRLT